MTQEDKELLLKDLCARVPYKTRVSYTFAFAGASAITEYSVEGILSYEKLQHLSLPNIGCERRWLAHIIPYLRPMSSMTEEEKNEHFGRTMTIDIVQTSKEVIDWLNAHHFDYRGLIEKGLALEAPEGMYKN